MNTHHRKIFLQVFGIVLLMIMVGSQSSNTEEQSPSISVNSGVDRNRITVGDLIRYSVRINRDKDLHVDLPGLAANLGQFEIRDYTVHETREFKNSVIDSLDYVITTFDTGSYIIPPLHIFIMKEDSSRDTLSTDPIAVRVESVMKGEAKDIRDIKAPLSIARDWSRYYLYGGIAFLIILLVSGGYWWYRRWKAGIPILPGRDEPIRPAHEAALEALDELVNSSLLSEGRIKEYHIQISDIIRKYIEGRYFVIAMEMTTPQLMGEIQSADMPEDIRDELETFLNDCDMVKFAKVIPGEEEIAETTRRAYDMVNQTKWVVEQPKESMEETETKLSQEDDNGDHEPKESVEVSESRKE